MAAPDATNIKFGGSSNTNTVNQNNETYIAYSWAETVGYSKFGIYNGNGNADGTFIYTGFKPGLIITKRTTGAYDWYIFDDKRPVYNEVNLSLRPNTSADETTASGYPLDILSNGFKIRTSNAGLGGGGDPYIYIAFASEPLVGDNPATAR